MSLTPPPNADRRRELPEVDPRGQPPEVPVRSGVPLQTPSPQPSPTRGDGARESVPCAPKALLGREGAESIHSGWTQWLGGRFLNAPRWLWLAFLGCSLVLVLFPGIDLAVSGLFYTPGVGFGARGTWFERLVHESTYWLLILGVPALIAVWWGQGRVGRPSKGDCPNLRSSPSELHPVQDSNLDTGIVPGTGIDIGPGTGTDTGIGPGTGNCRGPRPDGHILGGRDLAYLLLVLALGPGLIVNGLLKEHWGRARPVNCVEFGGSQTFTPAFVFSDQGGKSFSSGHAAGSAYWVVVALVLARGLRRRYWLGLAVGYSLLVAWARLAAGGHFFSDILISWLILALLARGLHGRFYPHPVTKPPVAAS